MFDVSRFFGKGERNTLLLKNGLNFSYNGPYLVVEERVSFRPMAREYIHVCRIYNQCRLRYKQQRILKVLVAASPNQSSLTIYGRSNLGNNLIKLNSTVDNSLVKVTVEPADKSQTEKYTGSKVIFGASYFATQNALVGGQQVTS